MVVVRHEHKGVQPPTIDFHRSLQPIQSPLTVRVVADDGAAFVAPRHHGPFRFSRVVPSPEDTPFPLARQGQTSNVGLTPSSLLPQAQARPKKASTQIEQKTSQPCRYRTRVGISVTSYPINN